MTSFSIASRALSNSALDCDFHGSTRRILSEMNWCERVGPRMPLTHGKEVSDEFDLLVDGERLLGEVGQETESQKRRRCHLTS